APRMAVAAEMSVWANTFGPKARTPSPEGCRGAQVVGGTDRSGSIGRQTPGRRRYEPEVFSVADLPAA
ncbi:MAG TPA: hypothetical protein VFW86_03005, partial [Candidatus Limnocylindrales bacterium]|nr:hypothetical protein [Candidatus Limnocylindrales bacterium]